MGVSEQGLIDLIQRNKRVRCIDCHHSLHLQDNHNWMGDSATDKYCSVPINGVSLLNGMRTEQAIRAWRVCPDFTPKTEEVTT